MENMDERKYSNPAAKPFQGNQALDPGNSNGISGSVATSKNIQNEVDYSPLVIAKVKSAEGVWIQVNCFLDMGSDTTLVRKDLVNNLGLPELGSNKLRGTCMKNSRRILYWKSNPSIQVRSHLRL